jgi:hypothetical protein
MKKKKLNMLSIMLFNHNICVWQYTDFFFFLSSFFIRFLSSGTEHLRVSANSMHEKCMKSRYFVYIENYIDPSDVAAHPSICLEIFAVKAISVIDNKIELI